MKLIDEQLRQDEKGTLLQMMRNKNFCWQQELNTRPYDRSLQVFTDFPSLSPIFSLQPRLDPNWLPLTSGVPFSSY